jgi:hypothetical protein
MRGFTTSSSSCGVTGHCSRSEGLKSVMHCTLLRVRSAAIDRPRSAARSRAAPPEHPHRRRRTATRSVGKSNCNRHPDRAPHLGARAAWRCSRYSRRLCRWSLRQRQRKRSQLAERQQGTNKSLAVNGAQSESDYEGERQEKRELQGGGRCVSWCTLKGLKKPFDTLRERRPITY